MRTLSLAQKKHILFMLDAGHSTHSIASIIGVHTSTISRLHSKKHSELHKLFGGCPTKLSPTNICHAVHLITTRKAENAVQVTKSLKNITNQSLSTTTVRHHLRKAGMKAVVKKNPLYFLSSIVKLVWTMLMPIKIGLWRTGKGWYGLMRPRSIA